MPSVVQKADRATRFTPAVRPESYSLGCPPAAPPGRTSHDRPCKAGVEEPHAHDTWPPGPAACYKGDWHLESLGFSLKFRLARLNSPRVTSTHRVRARRRAATGLEQIMEQTADIALIGLAVMGQNLILNMNDHGYTVVAYNRTTSKVDEFLNDAAKGRTTILGAHSIEEMVKLLKRPRKIMLMVKAGKPVDEFIETLLPHLEPGDLIIDGGNSHFPDTIRRTKYLESKGLLFIGTGVSGGEEGARFGPSMMPGGSVAAWPLVKDIFQAICAKTPDGEPCCDWVGGDGAGHFVKMVHNGIEYGDMQLICEAYQLMKEGLGLSNEEMHEVFAEWNKGELDSYLIEITRDILGYKDPRRARPWWTRSWTPPGRRARASGPASVRSTWACR